MSQTPAISTQIPPSAGKASISPAVVSGPLPGEFQRLLGHCCVAPGWHFSVGAIFVWQVTMLLSANALVEHYDTVIDHANQVQTLMVDMETGLRAYVITGDQKFLEPYDRAQQPLADYLGKAQRGNQGTRGRTAIGGNGHTLGTMARVRGNGQGTCRPWGRSSIARDDRSRKGVDGWISRIV